MWVNSAYDQHTWLYSHALDMLPDPPTSQEASAGDFLPWKLTLSREVVLPQAKERVPFEEIEVGMMRRGISDPESPDFNNLADWYAEGAYDKNPDGSPTSPRRTQPTASPATSRRRRSPSIRPRACTPTASTSTRTA